eukprot:CAMPEP_0116143362 /NCGR_PEP_ID=MMETSP0329-20121206/15409_1 /TAXON_ID=697910 /ORGANISM="Pseudo-nitzschia arenysensis, Strain B593" /LENGTH=539 /DNA_ID=CAMNT_0003638675 /DNA_START=129 /DNA_END=1748 /DNA_ORIENTATION=-
MTVCSSVFLLTTPLLLVGLFNADSVTSFLLETSPRSPAYAVVRENPGTPSLCTSKLGASEQRDEYDDFFDDFDPSDYEDYGPSNTDIYGDKYTRDTEVDNSNVDLEIVSTLLARRSEMKMTRQFDEADKIRDELLRNHGVLARDKDRKWRSGCSEGGNYRKWLHGGSSNQRGNFRSRDDFGPNGHDYSLAKDAGPNISSLSEERIHELLAKRLSYKFDRDFDSADAIQAELLSAGVVINGKGKEWRADGKFFSKYAPRVYKMLPHNNDISGDLEEIEKIIKERALCRAERLFKRSDELREELFQKFDVRINDQKQLWSVGADQNWDGTTHQPYRLSERSEVPKDADAIGKLVEERDRARGDRDFAKADEIRDELLEKNIIVDDNKRTWYIGKFSGSQHRGASNGNTYVPYVRRGGGDVSEDQKDEIDGLIKKRDEHKRKKQYADADTIRDILLNEFGVQVDDTNRQWHIYSTEYCLAHDSAEIDQKTRSMVQKKVQDRMLARGEKDYEKADTIKKVLLKKHNVVIDDRMREWTVIKKKN